MNTDETKLARKTALDLLARREHSRNELQAKLGTRGYTGAIVDTVLTELTDQGLLNEARFAEAYVTSRARRGVGPARLRAELRQRGLDDDAITLSLDDPDLDWADIARRARHKKFGEEPPADHHERARQTRFLQYRGFNGDQIRAAFGQDES